MRRGILLVALVLAAPSAVLAQAEEETPRLEQIIPDHSFGMVSLNDVSAMCAQAKRTALAKLWREPEMQEFLAPALRLLEREMKKVERKIGLPIGDLLDFFQGQAALALIEFDPMTGGMIPDAVALVDLGESLSSFKALHEMALMKFGSSLALANLEHRGVPYQSITVEMGVELSIAYFGNAVVVTSLPERMTSLIDAWKGGPEGSLAASRTYKAVNERLGGGEGFLGAFVNVESLLDVFGDLMDAETARIVDETGLSGLKALGYSARFVKEGVRDSFFAYVPGEKKGVVKLMYTAPGDGTGLLRRVPKNAFYASAFGLDLHGVGEVILETIGRIQPYVLDQVLGGITQAEDFLGLDIREDILKPFGAEHAMYVALPDGGGLVPDIVFMTRLRQPERFLESMGAVAAKARMMVEDDPRLKVELRQMAFGGKTIYYIYVMHKYGDPFPVTPACVLDGDVMAFALFPQTLKDWIARGADGPSILDRPDFERVRGGLPEDLTSIEYVDFQAAVRLIYGTLAPIAQLAGKAEGCPLDLALLPRTETIAKHFFGGIWGMKAGADGVVFHAYTPTGMLPVIVGVAGAAGLLVARVDSKEAGAWIRPENLHTPRTAPSHLKAPPPERVAAVEKPKRVVKARLEEIYIALLFHYAQTDAYAKDLGDLVESQALEDAGALVLPGDEKPLATASGQKSSFVYVGAAVGNILEGGDEAVWVYVRDGLAGGRRCVLFASGAVRAVPEEVFQKLLAKTRKRIAK